MPVQTKQTKPTPRALAQQQSAKVKRPLDDTDPKDIIAGGTTDDARSPSRKSPRLGASPIAKSQVPAQQKKKPAFSTSRADFAAVELQAENEETGLSTANELHVETTTSVTASAETEEETGLSAKDNEVLEDSAVRKTRSQNPNYREESDDDLPTKSSKGKEVQGSSSVDTTRGNKVGLDMEDSDDEDMGEEEPTGEEDPKDDGDSDENFISPVKQQPALAKLSRGRQHKLFSPAGNLTAP
jgi:hypothetical protein